MGFANVIVNSKLNYKLNKELTWIRTTLGDCSPSFITICTIHKKIFLLIFLPCLSCAGVYPPIIKTRILPTVPRALNAGEGRAAHCKHWFLFPRCGDRLLLYSVDFGLYTSGKNMKMLKRSSGLFLAVLTYLISFIQGRLRKFVNFSQFIDLKGMQNIGFV